MTTLFRLGVLVDSGGAVRGMQSITSAFARAETAAQNFGRTATGIFSALGLTLAIRELVRTADAYVSLNNRLRTVTDSTEQLTKRQEQLLAIANETRTSFRDSVELFTRFAAATKALGISQETLLGVTKSINQAIVLSGASSIEATNALRQLTQGLGAGALKGDELRSVLEQLPTVADVIAKQLGVTRGDLKKLGEQSKITSKVIVDAFRNAGASLDAAFAKTVPTISQALQVVSNNFLKLLGNINDSSGIFTGFAQVILFVANHLETLSIALGILGVAFLANKRVVQSAIETVGIYILELIRMRGNIVATVQNLSVAHTAFLKNAIGVAALTFVIERIIAVNSAAAESIKGVTEALEAQQRATTFSQYGLLGDQILRLTDQINHLKEVQAKASGGNALAARLIEQYTKQIERLRAEQKGLADQSKSNATNVSAQSSAYQKILKDLADERSLLKLSSAEREVEIELRKRVEALVKAGVNVTPTLKDELRFTIAVNKELEAKDKLLQDIIGGAQQAARDTANLAALVARGPGRGGISKEQATEFNDRRTGFQALKEEEGMLRLLVQGREAEARVLETVNRLREKGFTLSTGDQQRFVNQIKTNEILSRQVEIMNELQGPARQLTVTMTALQALWDAGAISAEQYGIQATQAMITSLESSMKFEDGLTRAFLKLSLEAQNFASAAEAAVNAFADNATEALVKFAETGKFNIKEFARSLVADLTRIIARLLVVQALTAALGGGTPAPIGQIPASQLPFDLPARAGGGPVMPGRPYLVGEHGPEIVLPRSGGTVVPAGQTAAALSAPQVNVQVVNVDDPSMIPQTINDGKADEAILNLISRNSGRINQTLGR